VVAEQLMTGLSLGRISSKKKKKKKGGGRGGEERGGKQRRKFQGSVAAYCLVNLITYLIYTLKNQLLNKGGGTGGRKWTRRSPKKGEAEITASANTPFRKVYL